MQLRFWGLILLALPTAASAQTGSLRSQTAPPAAVRQLLTELNATCRDATGTPGRSPDLLKVLDLTGDGVNDYVVDVGSYNCEGAASVMSNGQAGSSLSIFVGGPNNSATRAWSQSVYGNRIDRTGGRTRLLVDVTAQDCGQRGAANLPFAKWEFCSRPLNWDAAKHVFVFAPMAEKRRMP